MSYELRAAARSLLLPVAPSREDAFFNELREKLEAVGAGDDGANWISLQLRRWTRHKQPSQEFSQFVRSLLYQEGRVPVTYIFESLDGPSGPAYRTAAHRISSGFFDLHNRLVRDHLFPHDDARQILSHSAMITRLAVEERMTASEISRIISVRDNRFSLNWRAVNEILAKLRIAPDLTLDESREIFSADARNEPLLLGDLDIEGSIERISEIANSLGCRGNFSKWLKDIFIRDFHAPYLVLLHYQLLIQAKFDHAVTYAYEFKPRGQNVTWLTENYINAGIPVARNAFLNNAKATLRFDHVWVTGRTDHQLAATALANVLEAIENLGALAKIEISAQIRGLLHRYLRVTAEDHGGEIPDRLAPLTAQEAENLLRNIAERNTASTGILEQRLVDCLAVLRHSQRENWAARGLGDSVFAANVSRKKFGDVEFELPTIREPKIAAYEAHGGTLTEPYVLDHLGSFEFVLAARREELETISPLENWGFRVTFVAHNFGADLPRTHRFDDVEVDIEYIPFGAAAAEILESNDLATINQVLVDPLNTGYVHPSIRQIANQLKRRI